MDVINMAPNPLPPSLDGFYPMPGSRPLDPKLLWKVVEKSANKFHDAKTAGWSGSAWVAMNLAPDDNNFIEAIFRRPMTGHDWQAGLMPEYLRGVKNRPATVMTIHNIAFQGLARPTLIGKLGLDPYRFTRDGYEFWGKVSTLKAGLLSADCLTTVSHTYASELMTSEFGMGLEGVIRSRQDVLSGIVNGIDVTAWNPATDPAISAYKTPAGKAKNKAKLQEELELKDSDGPLCVVVSRLTQQKGLDLLLQALPPS